MTNNELINLGINEYQKIVIRDIVEKMDLFTDNFSNIKIDDHSYISASSIQPINPHDGFKYPYVFDRIAKEKSNKFIIFKYKPEMQLFSIEKNVAIFRDEYIKNLDSDKYLNKEFSKTFNYSTPSGVLEFVNCAVHVANNHGFKVENFIYNEKDKSISYETSPLDYKKE